MSNIRVLSMRNILNLIIATFVVVLVGCGGGGGSAGNTSPSTAPVATVAALLFTTAPDVLTLGVGVAQDFSIGGGVPPYTAVSNNAAIGTSGVKDTRLTIGGISPGSSEITIRDSLGTSIKIGLIVGDGGARALFTSSAADIVVAPGNSNAQIYTVGGGVAPYSATSSNSTVASASLVGDSLKITGLMAGAANIVVLDKSGVRLTIAITVPTASTLALFTTAPSTITVAIGASPGYSVGGGTGPYTATTNNAGIATTSLANSNLAITGVAVGSAIISVRDNAGTVVNINVTVGAVPLGITPNSATGTVNDRLVATITGGTAPFRASVGIIDVASASVSNGNQLNITSNQVGTTVITVLDANNQSTPYTLTVNAATPGIRLSPNPLAVSELDTQPIFLTVYGTAPGAVNVFSSDTSKLVATISGQTVTLITGSSGNRCVPNDLNVTITAVDSIRASGSAVVTIKKSIGACS